MYELNKHQLQKVETITTPKQVATVRTTVELVEGYDSESILTFGNIPEKQEAEGKRAELHYVDKKLEWHYRDAEKSKEEYIAELEQKVVQLETFLQTEMVKLESEVLSK